MLSQSKLAANRSNSQLSTGPRSDAGKSVVARNACKHNLASVNIAIAGEDLSDFHVLLHETTVDLTPRSTVEHALVQQIAHAEWKLLRIARWETDLIDATLAGRVAPCQALFGKSPDEALARLHRYESQIRRAWHAALREFRVQQKASSTVPVQQPSVAQALATMLKQSNLSLVSAIDKTNPTPPASSLVQPDID